MIKVTDELNREDLAEHKQHTTLGTYFIKCHNFIKIGGTADIPHIRLSTLQVGNPYELELIKFIEDIDENSIQSKFEHLKVRGEWYHLTPELEAYIAAIG